MKFFWNFLKFFEIFKKLIYKNENKIIKKNHNICIFLIIIWLDLWITCSVSAWLDFFIIVISCFAYAWFTSRTRFLYLRLINSLDNLRGKSRSSPILEIRRCKYHLCFSKRSRNNITLLYLITNLCFSDQNIFLCKTCGFCNKLKFATILKSD